MAPKKDEFLCGVLSALGCVYDLGQETVAEDIVKAVGASGLLRVAKVNEDIFLPDLRKTINFLTSQRRRVAEMGDARA